MPQLERDMGVDVPVREKGNTVLFTHSYHSPEQLWEKEGIPVRAVDYGMHLHNESFNSKLWKMMTHQIDMMHQANLSLRLSFDHDAESHNDILNG